MTGIQFVTDERGRKIAVQIDLRRHKALWEDIQDSLVVRARQKEKRYTLSDVEERLRKRGKLGD